MLNRLSLNRIGLNRIGLNRIGKPSGGSSDRPYIDPKVLDSLCGVWIMDQNTNESESRNIIKNKIADRGGDLELLNFAYKLNSGYNGYAIDFTTIKHNSSICIVTDTSVNIIKGQTSNWILNLNSNKESLPNFKCKITGLKKGNIIQYLYTISKEDTRTNTINIVKDGIYNFPASVLTDANLPIGIYNRYSEGNNNITIEQLPLHEGALVTDGKDDMIVSQKTVQEMGITDEITVVSMIHKISTDNNWSNLIGELKEDHTFVANRATNTDKTGIYGYTYKNNANIINNILGDKNDYIVRATTSLGLINKYYITGFENAGTITGVSQIAVYWTFISNKVLTTDEINQIIAYFKLDKYVTPQVIYDVKRQGLTNDTPAADWYLKDFSGNGYDMQLYNYAKELNSGVGKYAENFTTWDKYKNVVVTKDKISVNSLYNNNWLIYKQSTTRIAPMKVKIIGIPANGRIGYRYMKSSSDTVPSSYDITEDGIHDLPESLALSGGSVGFMITPDLDWTHIEIIQIPDYEGALVSDGKDDYGKAEGLPILKDYTVAIDRAIETIYGSVISKSQLVDNGAFIFEQKHLEQDTTSSFGRVNSPISNLDINRKISYQSKYLYNGNNISAGTGIDGNNIWLATIRDNDTRFSSVALYSMLLFPYSLSEFLLERQLKKYKLGTLYSGMIEWRPKVNINVPVVTPPTFSINNGSDIITDGQYIPEGTEITIRIFTATDGSVEGINEATAKINGVDIELTPSGNKTYYGGKFIISSKQKIDITIDEYIRFEDIVQPYPCIINIPKVDGGYYTYGDKIPVGYRFRRESAINLLPELYSLSDIFINGELCNVGAEIVISKSMVFTANKTWLLDTTEPHAIYSPQKLNIPNSSLKILGYIPDLTGKGNHGKLNNFAYTEDSGVAADGSIKFDSTDDHITIPTLAHGGKCVMMKVNLQNYDTYLYDQRNNWELYLAIVSAGNTIAYQYSNEGGKTYIDGILNEHIIDKDLIGITHNITVANSGNTKSYSPNIGTSFAKGNFANMSLYEFMLFPEIPSEDEIKKLNDVMGIEGGYVESPNYYWDAYGKKNIDTDRNLIADQVSKDVANALEVKNVGYNSESGYTDDNGLLLDGVEDHAVNTVIPAVTDFTVIAKREWLDKDTIGNECFIHKGAINTPIGETAFMLEYEIANNVYYRSSSYGGYINIERTNRPEKIVYQTPTSYNGTTITKGSGTDTIGLTLGAVTNNYWKGVFYKMMLYTKTIDQLSINMLKNLFERDELIDVTNPIFKKEEL